MRRVHFVVFLGALLVGCSTQSASEKAVEGVKGAIDEITETYDKRFATTLVEVDEATARTWPEKFCSLVVEMTRDEVRAVMGTPTLTFRDQTANQDQYEAWGYSLTIFYDIDDRAEIIQTNDNKVPCETRFRE